MPLVPMEILFCDQSQLSGFIATNIVQAIIGFYAATAIIIYGVIFIVSIRGYDFHVNLLAEDFQDLDNMWNGIINVSVAYRHDYLRNICEKRQDMNKYDFVMIKSTYYVLSLQLLECSKEDFRRKTFLLLLR